jgi:DNA (cytosine-5)-methyltransferase 1
MKDSESSKRISAVDLFCGVGGLTHGLALGGINVRAGLDVDPACRFAYEANNDSTFIEADVKDVTGADLSEYFEPGTYTLLAGCAPCQPFSTYARSGRSQKAQKDWRLVSEFGRLVTEMQPDLVTMENVTQLADHQVFESFLDSLKGYKCEFSFVECSEIGVPQSRKRLVLIASKLGAQDLTMKDVRRETSTVRETIYSLPKLRAGEAHLSDPLHMSSRLSNLNLARIKASTPGGTWRDWPEELRAACHKRSTGATYPSVYGRMSWDDLSPTITTQCFGYGNGRFGHPEQDRAISLREAAMLQTFPPTYQFQHPEEQVRFATMGRLIGNAVPVKLGVAISEALVRHVSNYA